MVIYGLHTGHDAALAEIEGNRLISSFELEKFPGERRYAWVRYPRHLYKVFPTLEEDDTLMMVGQENGGFTIVDGRERHETFFNSIGYTSAANTFGTLDDVMTVMGREYPVTSVYHTASHVIGSYCASPFPQRGEDAFVSMWDGGVVGMLYYVHHDTLSVDYIGQTTKYNGNVFLNCSLFWGPLKLPSAHEGNFENYEIERHERCTPDHPSHLDWRGAPGILMAYQGLGCPDPEVIEVLKEHAKDSKTHFPGGWKFQPVYWDLIGYSDPTIVASIFHHFGTMKMDKIVELVREDKDRTRNIVLTGGCALNIKWNSYLRRTGEFNEVWAPPFPNDSGVALGAAAVKMVIENQSWDFDWDVYRGQPLSLSVPTYYTESWKESDCTLEQLAKILWEEDTPVTFLLGSAELGPRALGHRSILASPVSDTMKHRLNTIKKRAPYRPVAPLCMEAYAPQYFTPGSPDPYMLFDHRVRVDSVEKIPAVIHVDGTARLQTVNHLQEPQLHMLLEYFRRLSGIPMLCNTSANEKGQGFFHSVEAAMDWGGTKYIWAEGTLYEKI